MGIRITVFFPVLADRLKQMQSNPRYIETVCLMCLEYINENNIKWNHPYVEGFICKKCVGDYLPKMMTAEFMGKCVRNGYNLAVISLQVGFKNLI